MAVATRTYIPEVSRERIEELARKIRPVVHFVPKGEGEEGVRRGEFGSENGELRYIEPVDLFGVAYTWDAKPAEPATGLAPVRDITTFHTWGYYGLFKPSIAEVLAQIPDDLIDRVVAFEIVGAPGTRDDLFGTEEAARITNDGYHAATTRLFERA
jgi:hypothetical protein